MLGAWTGFILSSPSQAGFGLSEHDGRAYYVRGRNMRIDTNEHSSELTDPIYKYLSFRWHQVDYRYSQSIPLTRSPSC